MTLSFFRRHRKWFMVLMFLSLFGILIFGWWHSVEEKLSMWWGSHPTTQKVGTINGKPVREGEVREFFGELRAAGEASQQIAMLLESRATTPEARQRLYANTMGATAWPIVTPTADREKTDRLTIMTWLALYEEARERGFVTSQAEVDARFAALAELGLSPEVLKSIVRRVAGGQRSRLDDAMRKDMALRSYINYLGEDLSVVVEPEMRREFVRMDERLKVRLEVIKAADLLPEVKDPAEAVLRQQFDKYKKFLAGQSPEGFGYRIPDRVQIEYLEASASVFEDAARTQVTDADVRAYYDANKDTEFLVKEEKASADKEKDKDKKEQQTEEAKRPEKKVRPFEEVRGEIRKTLIRRKAAALASERLNGNAAEIRSVKKPPDLRIWADGKQVRYAAIEGFKSAEQLAEIKGIGQAMRGSDRLPAYAVQVKGLAPAGKERLGEMEISDVFTDPDGNAYVMRVTGIEPNHEPSSLQEVRDKVVADVRQVTAMQLARERGTALMDAAAAKGLEAAAKDLKLKPTVESDWFPREYTVPYGGRWVTLPATLPEVGSNRMVVAECFRMAADGRQRAMVTLAEQREVVVVELVGRKMPREAAYERLRPLLATRVGQQVAGIVLRQALDLGSIQRRNAVVCDVTDEIRGRGRTQEPESDDL
jgi:hypothetical protein